MNTFTDIPLAEITPSRTNPRKDFDSAAMVDYLNELAATIRQKGVLQPILVRPAYCVGARTRAEIEATRWTGMARFAFEIIAGECRWRASQVAQMAKIPCIVTEMTDDDAREAQQIENLQRRDLNPLDEAEGIAEMLALKNDEGKPRYTAGSLAEKLGASRAWISSRRAWIGLPQCAKTALKEGRLDVQLATLIASIPVTAAREEFAEMILKPELVEGPLTRAQARALRDEKFIRVLRSVPFALDDGELVPSAGACLACPKMSANCAEVFAAEDAALIKQRTCLDPQCYRTKLAALQVRQAAAASGDGKVMLPAAESEKIYPFYTATGEMDPKSPYVALGSKPAAHLLKREVTKVDTWQTLVEEAEEKTGVRVPRIVIADQQGIIRDHVETKLAIAAIEKAGEPIFRETDGATAPKGTEDPFAVQKKAEADRAKVQWTVAKAALDAVWAALLKGWDSAAVWEELFYIGMTHAGDNGLGVIASWRGLKIGDGEFGRADAVEIWRNKLSAAERDALIPLLLVAGEIKHHGAQAEDFKGLARALEVNLGAVEKQALADLANADRAAKLTPAQLEAKVRELAREKMSAMAIAVSLGLPLKKIDKVLAKVERENAAATKETTAPLTVKPGKKAKAAKQKAAA